MRFEHIGALDEAEKRIAELESERDEYKDAKDGAEAALEYRDEEVAALKAALKEVQSKYDTAHHQWTIWTERAERAEAERDRYKALSEEAWQERGTYECMWADEGRARQQAVAERDEALGMLETSDTHWAAEAARRKAAEAALEEMKSLVTELVPFIGYEAYVPELVQRAEDAVDYARAAAAKEERKKPGGFPGAINCPPSPPYGAVAAKEEPDA